MIKPNKHKKYARGINTLGEEVKIEIHYYSIYCANKDLVSLTIPPHVRDIHCHNNLLTSIDISSHVKYLKCDKEVKGLGKYIDRKNLVIELY